MTRQEGCREPQHPPAWASPVELTINTTKIGQFFDSLLTPSPPPGAPVASPPPAIVASPPPVAPAPPPAPQSNFTVPDVAFSPLPPLTIAPVPTSTVGRKLLQGTTNAPGLVTTTNATPTALHVSHPIPVDVQSASILAPPPQPPLHWKSEGFRNPWVLKDVCTVAVLPFKCFRRLD